MAERLKLKNAAHAAEELAGIERAIAVLIDYRDGLKKLLGTTATGPAGAGKASRPATARKIAEAMKEKAAARIATVKEAGLRTAKENPTKAEVKKATRILARRRLNSLLKPE